MLLLRASALQSDLLLFILRGARAAVQSQFGVVSQLAEDAGADLLRKRSWFVASSHVFPLYGRHFSVEVDKNG